jgi:hypothetical protein
MLGFSGFPRQPIVAAAARLAMLVANSGRNHQGGLARGDEM